MRQSLRPLVPLTALVLLAGCGSIAENVTERIVEEGIEQAGENGIDVDLDTDGDGGLRVTSSEGSLQVGAQDIPADWPGEVVFPDGLEVQSTQRNQGDGVVSYSYTGIIRGSSLEDVIATIDGAVTDAGYESQSASDFTGNGGAQANRSWVNGDNTVNALLSDDDEGVFVVYTASIAAP